MFDGDVLDQDYMMEEDPADTSAWVHCPYCGQPSELVLDPGGGEDQSYVEDCEICCRPWNVHVRWEDGVAQVSVSTEDDGGWY